MCTQTNITMLYFVCVCFLFFILLYCYYVAAGGDGTIESV